MEEVYAGLPSAGSVFSVTMVVMNTKVLFQDAAAVQTPLLAVFAVDVAVGKDADPMLALLTTSDAISEAAASVLNSGEFKGGLCETLLLHAPVGVKAERLLVVGLGKVGKLSIHQIRKGAGTAVRFCKPRGLRDLTIAFPEDHALSDEHLEALPCDLTTRAMVEGAELAELDWDTYKSDRKDKSVASCTIVSKDVEKTTKAEIQKGLDDGLVIAAAQNFTRGLVNEPGNVLTPTELGKRAAAMCAESGLTCEVFSTEKLHELGMGAFWAVSQGSPEPPALIVMTYEPASGHVDGAPVLGLVGKGITFDTGGISIKPADGMEKMKYDMAGAGAMIGAMKAIAGLKPKVKVISVICSAENMPDGKAFKPGDVVTAMSGKTIEIVNTDAEGRLVLADGLHYAKTLGCTHLINAATLTGAVAVALGKLNVGLFSNSDDATELFMAGLKASGEKYWRLPCTDDYKDQIKSAIADIQNTGITRYGGSITAAMFLKEFVGDTPWIHLDIAACAWLDEVQPWIAKGPSGIGVRSLVEWVKGYAS
ncbi:leucyl aminopeptidase [Granulicella pectinivorans]|uniref:Probable cytosol aminopeptidase n=2 Tax=Granulicella pectinivorans TaxID=474950 RepID=A0A1I6MJS5_9BACT|nr:leucyl aminopeptidase [Granulicella pectinivorans]